MTSARALAMVLAGCSGSPASEVEAPQGSTTPTGSTADTGAGVSLPPTDAAELEAWLDGGAYLDWPAEPAVHAGAGPHFGQVRVFVNPALADSLVAGGPHAVGAATVKELWGNGDDLLGFSVMVKTDADSDAGRGWYWYERYDGTTYADGNGVGLCSGCHSAGIDFVLTPWPG